MVRLVSRPLVLGLTVAGFVVEFAGAALLAYNVFAR
jgi:hypothetical protein